MSQDPIRQACENLYDELWNGVVALTPDERLRCIERALKAQRAGGVVKVLERINTLLPLDPAITNHEKGWNQSLKQLKIWCEQRAKELEGA